MGLSAKTVGSLRRSVESPPVTARIGRDGRLRPVDGAAGRRAAAELIAIHPDATLRRIARDASISVETARSVRQRLLANEDPVLDRRTRRRSVERPVTRQMTVKLPDTDPSEELRTMLDTIHRDPSLRYTESGRMLLRWPGPRGAGARRGAVIAAPHPTAMPPQPRLDGPVERARVDPARQVARGRLRGGAGGRPG